MYRKFKINHLEVGVLFKDGKPEHVLKGGTHRLFGFSDQKARIDVIRQRESYISHPELDVLVESELFKDDWLVFDLNDHQRALVWIDQRFSQILGPGLHVFWKAPKTVRVEVMDLEDVMFLHKDMQVITRQSNASEYLDCFQVAEHHIGLYFLDGAFVQLLNSGPHYFWKGMGKVKLYHLDLREKVKDITGQEIMTKDKVTLRVNATLTYRLSDPLLATQLIDDLDQSLYREAQFALRSALGTRVLDDLLSEKQELTNDLVGDLKVKLEKVGVELLNLGIKDIILPGEMKDLFNQVTEAQKVAEANLISRREEVAAMRSQANSAKMLEASPALMRLKELEVLENIASKSQLQLIVGEKGLSESLIKMI